MARRRVSLIHHHGQSYRANGEFKLNAGFDLLLVALLQMFSYPFHDPVLTDRGFVNKEKTMLKSFVVAGLLGFVAVFIFSLVGVHARLNGIEAMGNAPAAVGQSLGLAALFFMSVIMMTSAGSTLDSTFSSLAKSLAVDLPRLAKRAQDRLPSVRVGAVIMVIFAFLGNLPMFAGTDILKATTISGTMVMGLAPVVIGITHRQRVTQDAFIATAQNGQCPVRRHFFQRFNMVKIITELGSPRFLLFNHSHLELSLLPDKAP